MSSSTGDTRRILVLSALLFGWLAVGASAVDPGCRPRPRFLPQVYGLSALRILRRFPKPRLPRDQVSRSSRTRLVKDFPMEALDLDFHKAVERLTPQDRGSVTTMLIRTKHLDAALDEALRDGTSQIIILGAGFDSRGYRFRDRLRGVRFLEVDYGPTQEHKKQRVREVLGALPRQVRYVPMDFTKDDLLTQLGKGGYIQEGPKPAHLGRGHDVSTGDAQTQALFVSYASIRRPAANRL